jgi:hypothetical protein
LRFSNENGGFGETPKPTVKVWMGEGMIIVLRSKKSFLNAYFVM